MSQFAAASSRSALARTNEPEPSRSRGTARLASWIVASLCCLALLSDSSLASRLFAQDDDDDEPLRAGLVATYIDASGAKALRVDSTPMLTPATAPPDRRLSSPRFSVVWRGVVQVQAPGEYRLAAFAAGRLRVKWGDTPWLDASLPRTAWTEGQVRSLDVGQHAVEIELAPVDSRSGESRSGDSRPGEAPAPKSGDEANATGDKRADTDAAAPLQLGLYWAGPQFALEPIPARFFAHDKRQTPSMNFERGRRLVRELRCASCHSIAGEPQPTPAPALDRLGGQIEPAWINRWLDEKAPATHRRMPRFALTDDERNELSEFLRSQRPPAEQPTLAPRADEATKKPQTTSKAAPKKGASPPRTPSVSAGRELLVTVGCLACHASEGLGRGDGPGGDLSHVGDKRPAEYFARWLADPASLNKHHRMPVFELSGDERTDLTLYLSSLKENRDAKPGDAKAAPSKPAADSKATDSKAADGDRPAQAESLPKPALVAEGRTHFKSFHCDACHAGPGHAQPAAFEGPALDASARWNDSCLGAPHAVRRRPGYELKAADAAAVREFISQVVAPKIAKISSKTRSTKTEPKVATKTAPQNSTKNSTKNSTTTSAGELGESTDSIVVSGRDVLDERQCLACHARDGGSGLTATVGAVVERHGSLAPRIPAFTPPSLTSVGDKLHDSALDQAIARSGAPRRPWLAARMPKFALSDAELRAVREELIGADRVPDGAPHVRNPATDDAAVASLGEIALRTTGGRLVTPDGFGCTSCHDLGGVSPANTPLNARAPDLTQAGKRIRREWFERWVRNPARIVPRMEMPSVQLAVRGVLDDQLGRQLSAVWHVLNLPDFVPPEPNPVQTLRQSGLASDLRRAELVTDLLMVDGKTLIKPLLIGLTNRHNVLFDFESGRLARWSLGDVARQRTKGKSWYWEATGVDLLRSASDDVDISLRHGEQVLKARVDGQFPTEPDAWRHLAGGGFELSHRLRFAEESRDKNAADSAGFVVRVTQIFTPIDPNSLAAENGFRREVRLAGVPRDATAALQLVASQRAASGRLDERRETLTLDDGRIVLRAIGSGLQIASDGSMKFAVSGEKANAEDATELRAIVEYRTKVANDQYIAEPPKTMPPSVERRDRVPGFTAVRLPMVESQMPTAIAWRPDGSTVVASLKGRVWSGRDTDRDGLEDRWTPISDELAAPFGVATGDKYVDVTAKFGVVRLWDEDGDGFAERSEVVASGWGHTADYHDWTVGLPSDGRGGYFIGLACQQDKRSLAAARLRGTVVQLTPRTPTFDDPRRFSLELLSGGHRFPMGIARNRAGDVFVTDNQGNYNPFNELNHVLRGRRYGFINAVEQAPDFKPPTEPPAIDIPHPWTRSVNGICFLDTPVARTGKSAAGSGDAAGGDASSTDASSTDASSTDASAARKFGPFEGQLVGCEYDTRRLIRMSLEKVGDTYQGAAYPLTLEPTALLQDGAKPAAAPGATTTGASNSATASGAGPHDDTGLLGPLCAAVSPRGELYIGGIRDSGWGGGNNIGELLRLTFDPATLPAGIAEMRATSDGFELLFTQPVDVALAKQTGNYQLASYRRISTPAYGGADVDRRTETLSSVEVAADGRSARLKLPELRAGFVYELRVKNLAGEGRLFHPAEAHYTLRSLKAR